MFEDGLEVDVPSFVQVGLALAAIVEVFGGDGIAQVVEHAIKVRWEGSAQDGGLDGGCKLFGLHQEPMGAQGVARVVFTAHGHADALVGVDDDSVDDAQ